MATYSSWGTIFWSIFDACYTSEHPFFSGFEAEKGLLVIHACVVYTTFYGICRCYCVNKVKYGNFSNSRADNLDSSGPITSIIDLIRDLMITYILTNFSADWSIFVDDRV